LKPSTELNINENVLCDTQFLGVIKFSGEDVSTFLQGQFSHDVTLLDESTSQFNSYNSPKGRMYASFRLFKSGNDFFMVLPKEIIEPIIKRLRMFVMRSKVVIEDLSENWACIGLSGALTDSDTSVPENLNAVQHNESLHYIRVPGIDTRVLIIGPTKVINEIKQRLADSLTLTDSQHWKRLDIHAGLPNIYSATQESFVLQMVNLQLIDGVSFTKGCYPGQEVVARMHYLGKLKKRMYRITINQNSAPAPGDNLTSSEETNAQSIGQIVDAQLNNTGSIDALAVIQNKAVESGDIIINDNSVIVNDLPYSF